MMEYNPFLEEARNNARDALIGEMSEEEFEEYLRQEEEADRRHREYLWQRAEKSIDEDGPIDESDV
jgi:hypothetical protein